MTRLWKDKNDTISVVTDRGSPQQVAWSNYRFGRLSRVDQNAEDATDRIGVKLSKSFVLIVSRDQNLSQ
jgi:hypothetical protein